MIMSRYNGDLMACEQALPILIQGITSEFLSSITTPTILAISSPVVIPVLLLANLTFLYYETRGTQRKLSRISSQAALLSYSK